MRYLLAPSRNTIILPVFLEGDSRYLVIPNRILPVFLEGASRYLVTPNRNLPVFLEEVM
jgi:hypothetical protein